MVQYYPPQVDAGFAALADGTRRGVIEALMRDDASISELAERFHMSLTGMKKHVDVLEQVGLVTTCKVGRVRTCRLGPGRLEQELAWIEGYRRIWAERYDALDNVIEDLTRKAKTHGA